MTAAIELFAERGFDGTSVGEIERAAGLAPRSGALYQHFKGASSSSCCGARSSMSCRPSTSSTR